MLGTSGAPGQARRPRVERELEAVQRVSRSVLETDLWGVAATVARSAVHLVGAQQGSVGLVDEGTGEIYTAASLELPNPRGSSRFARGEGVAGWVAATGRPALIHDVRKDARYLRLRYLTVRSFLSVPMGSGGELVGVLSCGAWEVHAFGDLELKSLASFSDHAATMLRLARELGAQRAKVAWADRFLLDAVHELKTPIHLVSGMLDVVVREGQGLPDGRRADFLATARQECARLSHMVAALLEMGRAQQRPDLRTQAVELGPLAAEVVDRLRPLADLRQVRLAVSIPESLPITEVDSPSIQQVLNNLIGNGIKVSPPNATVEVAIEAWVEEVCISVADAGPGLPMEHRELVFDRFYQAEPAERAPGNVGLGLALSRDIVERHGGRIWAESTHDGGACIRFTLPLARGA